MDFLKVILDNEILDNATVVIYNEMGAIYKSVIFDNETNIIVTRKPTRPQLPS